MWNLRTVRVTEPLRGVSWGKGVVGRANHTCKSLPMEAMVCCRMARILEKKLERQKAWLERGIK